MTTGMQAELRGPRGKRAFKYASFALRNTHLNSFSCVRAHPRNVQKILAPKPAYDVARSLICRKGNEFSSFILALTKSPDLANPDRQSKVGLWSVFRNQSPAVLWDTAPFRLESSDCGREMIGMPADLGKRSTAGNVPVNSSWTRLSGLNLRDIYLERD